MHLLLIRHLESAKNTQCSISSPEDREGLTRRGYQEGKKLAEVVSRFQKQHSLSVSRVYCANSTRSKDTADLIAAKVGAVAESYDDLRSTRSGVLAGLSEVEAAKISPRFIWQLQLYRAGLLSSYELERAEGKEPIQEFERRVRRRLLRILTDDSETLKLIISHRSPLTAMLLFFARNYYRYPRSFYGHVPLNLGYISWLQRDPEKGWEFQAVNCPPTQILLGGNLLARSHPEG